MFKTFIKILLDNSGYEIKAKENAVTFFQVDQEFDNFYRKAMSATQMEVTDNILRRQRHYVLNYLLRNIRLKDGDVCEAGCWRGLSSYQIASYIKSKNEKVCFHIFDSFEGLSELESVDKYENDTRDIDAVRKHLACSLEEVQNNLKEFDFIKYYKGWIPGRFHEVKDKKFSFINIDVDLYKPIKESFEFFHPRLIPQGIIVFDDYGSIQFPGAKKAIDECLVKYKKDFFLPLPSGQAFLIKDYHK